MLHVTCPRPSCPAVLGRVGSHRQRRKHCVLLEYCSQRPQQITSALPSYQDVLKEGLVQNLSELARSIRKRSVPARTVKESRRQGQILLEKLIPKGSSIEDVNLSADQTAQTVHALSVLGSHEYFGREMELLLQVAAREVQQSNSARTIQLLYSAAKASHYSSALEVLATSKRVLDDLPAMQPSLVRQLLWALAILNLKPRAVLDRLKAAMAATVGSASGKLLLQYCWSLAVLEQTGSEAFWIPWRALSQKQPKEIGISISDATLYCQVVAENPISCHMWTSTANLLSYLTYRKLRIKHLEQEERVVSSLHRDIMTALALSGTKYKNEAVIDIYSVDIAVPDYKVAIEVDGPSHFTRTRPKRHLGPTLMKQRHLKEAGWVVVSVSSDDWDARDSWEQKKGMLKDLFYTIEKQRLKGVP